jgi:hypothetical protein
MKCETDRDIPAMSRRVDRQAMLASAQVRSAEEHGPPSSQELNERYLRRREALAQARAFVAESCGGPPAVSLGERIAAEVLVARYLTGEAE